MKRLDEFVRKGTRPVYENNADGIPVVVREETVEVYEPLQLVQGGTRFMYYLADLVGFGAFAFLLGIVYGVYIYSAGSSASDDDPMYNVIGYLGLFLYYVGFESVFQQTPGKMFAKVVVVDEYGQKPTIGAIMLRSIIRFIPFEAFSCLGDQSRGWHDKWSKTYVIRKDILQERLNDLQDQEQLTYDSLIAEPATAR